MPKGNVLASGIRDAAVPVSRRWRSPLQKRGHGDRRRHDARTRAGVPELWDRSGGFTNDGPFTPFTFHEDGAPPKSTISFPGGTGGVNWGGTATDPRTGYIYVNSHDTSLVGWVEKKKPGVTYASIRPARRTSTIARAWTASDRSTHSPAPAGKDANGRDVNLPCQRPPWSRLIAINANTGDIAWETTLGGNDFLPAGSRTSAAAAALAYGDGRRPVFVGATDDRRFRVRLDRKSCGTLKLDKGRQRQPMTYQAKNGKQCVAIVATDTLVVFALP